VEKAIKGLGRANTFANDMQATVCNQMLHNMLHHLLLTAVSKTMPATCIVAGTSHLLYVSLFAK
jgi:hypothetical protein